MRVKRLTLDQWLEVLTLSILLGFPVIYFSLTFYDVLYKYTTNDARITGIIEKLK